MDSKTRKELREQYKTRKIIGGIYRYICNETEMSWLRKTTDLKGAENRFTFSQITNNCPDSSLVKYWNKFGSKSFTYEILEEIEKKETQSDQEFAEDLEILLEIWTEKLNSVN